MTAQAFPGTVIVRYIPEVQEGLIIAPSLHLRSPNAQRLVKAEVISSAHEDYQVGEIVMVDAADGFQCDHYAFDFIPKGEKWGFYKDDLLSAIPVKMTPCSLN